MRHKVYVALSGGVDSAVSAALLKHQGHVVIGVHMKLWESPVPVTGCSWQQDLEVAREVAQYFEIPFEVWDFTKQYQDRVVEYLFRGYEAGRTPNPDVMCNRDIKFGLFYYNAIKRGADFVATGHYARIVTGNQLKEKGKRFGNTKQENRFPISDFRTNFRFPTTNFYLLRGTDPNKDQSYFLWAIDRNKLSRIFFPVGNLTKTEVRQLAQKVGLPNAKRKDSQGICFVGKINLTEFLKLRIPEKRGEIVTTKGEVLGQHQGSWYYTVGQRHGFGSAVGQPQYVVDKDTATNRLVVAPQGSDALYAKEAVVSNVNWLVDSLEIRNLKLEIEVRYHQKPVSALIAHESKGRLKVQFSEPIRAVAPGQSMVFYKDNLVLGGGIIEETN